MKSHLVIFLWHSGETQNALFKKSFLHKAGKGLGSLFIFHNLAAHLIFKRAGAMNKQNPLKAMVGFPSRLGLQTHEWKISYFPRTNRIRSPVQIFWTQVQRTQAETEWKFIASTHTHTPTASSLHLAYSIYLHKYCIGETFSPWLEHLCWTPML